MNNLILSNITKYAGRIFVFLFILFNTTISTQNLIYLPQGYVLDGLSGIGYSKTTTTTLSNIINTNPSLLHDFDKIGVGFSYQFTSKIKNAWIANISHSRISSVYPQSIGLVIPILYFRLGFGMSQLFNSEIDYGLIEGSIVWNNDDGYIETDKYRLIKTEYVVKSSVTFTFPIQIALIKSDRLNLGVQYNDYRLSVDLDNSNIINQFSINSNSSNYSVGILYDIDDVIFNNVRLGMFYESQFEFRKWVGGYFASQLYKGSVPEKYHIGITFKLNSKSHLTINNSFILWEKLNRDYHIKNNNDLSINFGYHLTNNIIVTSGFVSTDHVFENTNPVFDLDELEAIYIIFGLRYAYKSFLFDFNLSDSHLFSEKLRKQTIVNLGIGYSL